VPWQLQSSSTKDLDRLDASLSLRLPRGPRSGDDADDDDVAPQS